jgi:hypothetical protein
MRRECAHIRDMTCAAVLKFYCPEAVRKLALVPINLTPGCRPWRTVPDRMFFAGRPSWSQRCPSVWASCQEKNMFVEFAREEPGSTSFDQKYLMNISLFSNRIWELRPVVVRKRRWRSLGLKFLLKMVFAQTLVRAKCPRFLE